MSEPNTGDPAERRKHTRHEIVSTALLYFDIERTLIVDIADLSYEGLCIEAGNDELATMLPTFDSSSGIDKVPLHCCFDVVKDDHRYAIKLLASTVYLKPVTADRSQLGLEIVDVEQGVLELADYIACLD